MVSLLPAVSKSYKEMPVVNVSETVLRDAVRGIECPLVEKVVSESLFSFYQQYQSQMNVEKQTSIFHGYTRGVSLNEKEAYLGVAICYLLGIGTSKDLEASFNYLLEASQKGVLEAKYLIASCFYMEKNGKRENSSLAFSIAEELIQEDYPFGFVLKGTCLQQGMGTIENKEESLENFKIAASKGVSVALFYIGFYYLAKKEDELSFPYFLKAAEKGDPHGLLFLAHSMRKRGHYETAFIGYLKAESRGSRQVFCYLGHAYLKGQGTRKNENLAFQYFLKAHEIKDESVLPALYFCYSNGIGTEKNEKEAEEILEKTDKTAEGASIYLMKAHKYLKEEGDTLENQRLAFENFNKAAERGNSKALYAIATSYLYGHGVEKSIDLAFENMSKAAVLGDEEALYKLGQFYEEGVGTPIKLNLAFQNYEKAVRAGHQEAVNRLGLCYLNGIGVEPNDALAFDWFFNAFKRGSIEGAFHIAKCYEKGIGVEKHEKMAFLIYQRAIYLNWVQFAEKIGFSLDLQGKSTENFLENTLSEKNRAILFQKLLADAENKEVFLLLGLCYHKGMGVNMDWKLALKYYRLAASLNIAGGECLEEGLIREKFNPRQREGIKNIYAAFAVEWSLSFTHPLLKQSFDLHKENKEEAQALFHQFITETSSTIDTLEPFTGIKCVVEKQERRLFRKPRFCLVDAITREFLKKQKNIAFSTGQLVSERSFFLLIKKKNENPFNREKILSQETPFFIIPKSTFKEMQEAISFFYENLE